MNRFTSIRRLLGAGLVATAVIVACRTSEAPPLAPRPDPLTPTSTPVPGAPDPIQGLRAPSSDGGIVPAVHGGSTAMSFAAPKSGGYATERDAGVPPSPPPVAPVVDAAIGDAVNLPPVPDASIPPDANRFPAHSFP